MILINSLFISRLSLFLCVVLTYLSSCFFLVRSRQFPLSKGQNLYISVRAIYICTVTLQGASRQWTRGIETIPLLSPSSIKWLDSISVFEEKKLLFKTQLVANTLKTLGFKRESEHVLLNEAHHRTFNLHVYHASLLTNSEAIQSIHARFVK